LDEGRGKIARLWLQPRLHRDFHDYGPVVGQISRSVVEVTRPAFGDAATYLPLRIASQVGVVSHTGPSDC